MAFKIAGSMAFKEACRKANAVPAGAHHEGLRHRPRGLHGRCHRRLELPPRPDPGPWRPAPAPQQIDALVPLAEMFGYATDLRSRTQGRGQYSMEPHSYVEIPKSIADKIVASATARNNWNFLGIVQEIRIFPLQFQGISCKIGLPEIA